jgi:hypothetical protein
VADSGRDEHGKASLWMEPASSAPRCAAAQRTAARCANSIQVPSPPLPTSDALPPSSRGDDPQGDTADHAGGARARGRAAGLLQVAAIAAVSVLLTLLVAGNVQVSVQFGDTTRPPPAAAPPPRSLELNPNQSQTREPGPSGLPPPAPSSLTDSSREPADATGKGSRREKKRERKEERRNKGGSGGGGRGGSKRGACAWVTRPTCA